MNAGRHFVLAGALALWSGLAAAGEATLAVAANFLRTAEALAVQFEAETGHRLRLVHGATGVLTAQIERGAPFDVFLAADMERPLYLQSKDLGGDVKPYALGRLAYAFTADTEPPVRELSRIAMANPRLAPYGRAAEQVLARWNAAPERVLGENVGQALSFVVTGNARAGLVAMAQVLDPRYSGAWTVVDPALYAPIVQGAVLTRHGQGNAAAEAFFTYLTGPDARALIEAAGYGLPEAGQ